MRRLAVLVAMLILCSAQPINASSSTTFKNCTELRRRYKFGVAVNFNVTGTSKAKIARSVYLKNQRLDVDRDGIACERENLQSVPLATSTTTAPATLKTPISDLNEFVSKYGKAVVTIECRSGLSTATGSGTSIRVSFSSTESVEKGIKSALVTNHHVVEKCLTGAWLNRQVVVKTAGGECVGYVSSWDTKIDIATVFTTCVVPYVSEFTGSTVGRPTIGDVAVIIGSTAGIAGTSAQGAIANLTDSEVLTSAPAGPGSSGGALFNRFGELLGIIQGAIGTLSTAIPITKFPGSVYADTVTVSWRG